MDEFYKKKPVQGDVEMPLPQIEEEKKQGEPSVALVPQLQPIQEERVVTGTLRVQDTEESKSEVFMTAKADDPQARRIQMTEQLRKSKRKEIISKKRENMALNQILQEGAGYSEQEFYLPSQEDEYGYEDPSQQPVYTADQYLNH